VIAMTALVMEGDREKCLAAGMDGYLSKPIRQQELDQVLNSFGSGNKEIPQAQKRESVPQVSVNTHELLERVDGDRELIAELLELLRNDYPRQIEAMHRAIDSNNSESLEQVAHSMRGALGNLAAVNGAVIASELERIGKSGCNADAPKRLAELEVELGRVVCQLEGLCMETVR
jgi:two-component system sensor histidine kinase/response regulator